MYCSSCGVAVAQGLSYCNFCGAKLNRDNEESDFNPPIYDRQPSFYDAWQSSFLALLQSSF